MFCVDGVGAYDHVLRAAQNSWTPKSYLSPSSYSWEDEEGQRHTIEQRRVVNQATRLAIHDAIADVQGHLENGELPFAFLNV